MLKVRKEEKRFSFEKISEKICTARCYRPHGKYNKAVNEKTIVVAVVRAESSPCTP